MLACWTLVNKVIHVAGKLSSEVIMQVMALLCYMNVLLGHNGELPDPAAPLLSSLSSSVIEEANMALTNACQEEEMNVKRGPYLKLSNETRAKISKFGSENRRFGSRTTLF